MGAWAQQGLQGSGTSTEPYLIQSAGDWDTFAQSVTNGTTYADQFVKLDADITVTTMAGSRSSDSDYHAFSGTFLGFGHTLTLDYSTTLNDAAPFRVINGATIQGLHIAGTIETSGQFNGVVGHAYGTNSLTNCRSSITINSSVNGDGTHGGFVGVIGNGTTTFTGCVFDGTFTSTSTIRWGGFVGFVEGNNQAHANFTDCMFAPANSSFGFNTEESQTFARLRDNNSNYATFSNCYYTKQLGGAQGKQARSITGIKSANVAFSGNATTYGVSGIYAYSVGMKYAGTCYAGNGETVSLILSHGNHPGITYGNGYNASASTLNGTGNPYTLTMPNQNVTIAPNITAYTVSVVCNPNIADAAQVSLDNTNWSSSVTAAADQTVYFKPNNVIGYNYSDFNIALENGNPVYAYTDHFTMPDENVTVTVSFTTKYDYPPYTVTLSPGEGSGNPIDYYFDPATAAPNAATAENLQFYYVNYNTLGFRLSYDYCPSSFTVPNGVYFIGWDGWSNNGYITLTSTETTFTAQWGNPIPPLTPSTYIDGNGEYHTCSNYTVLTGGQGQTILEGGWYVVDSVITYSNSMSNALTLNGDVTLILCNGKTMTVTAGGVGIDGNGHSLTIYGQSLDPNVAGTLNVNSNGYDAISVFTYTQHSGKVIFSNPNALYAIFTKDFTLNGGSLEARGNNCGILTDIDFDLTINGGTVTATSTLTDVAYAGISGGGNVVINGGKVEANKISARYNITLGYTHPDDYIKSGNFSYAYSGSGTVSVKSGQTFYYINGVENVTVSGTIANPNSTIAGKTLRPYFEPITVTKTIAGYGTGNGGWHLIASPLQGNNYVEYVSGLISATASHYDLYRFNQDAELEWENYKANSPTNHPDFITLRNGRGYLYAHSTDTTLTFIGVPYSGNGVVDLTYSEVNPDANMHGWNLVGNPFGTAANLPSELSYYTLNGDRTELTPGTASTIEAMEAIFVKATATGQSVTFTQATRDTKASPKESQRIVLDLGHGGAVIDRAIVRLGEGQTLPKFQIRDNSTKIYIPQDGTDYAVAVIASEAKQSTEQPIHFKPSENGTYTLTANIDKVEMSYLHLVDNMTGADVDLLTPPACGHPITEGDVPLLRGQGGFNKPATYTFTAKTTDYESRFKLVFSLGGDANDDDEDAPFAFVNNGNIIVNGEGWLQVMDVMGRVIVSGDAINRVSTGGMAAGVYVLRLINGEDVKTQKIVIR